MGSTPTYMCAATHPIDLDDGTVIAPGEFRAGLDTRGPLAKHLIESGQLIRAGVEASERAVEYTETHQPDEPKTKKGKS